MNQINELAIALENNSKEWAYAMEKLISSNTIAVRTPIQVDHELLWKNWADFLFDSEAQA